MSSPDQSGDRASGVGPFTAVAFATVAFATVAFATLVIFGFGMLSLALSEDVIEVRGLGPVPGILSLLLATVAFALLVASAVRGPAPSYWAAAWVTAAVVLVYLATLWVATVSTGADLAAAASVVGRIATTWFGVVLAGAAAISSWGGIALVRTRATRPRWPWESDEDE